MSGVKYDDKKPRIDLVPASTLFSLGRVLEYGANKYDTRNWEEGLEYGRLFGALQRHIWAWWGGEDLDPESGLPHIEHALCCLSMLNEMRIKRPDLDDRSKL